jgi:hypothetical protein
VSLLHGAGNYNLSTEIQNLFIKKLLKYMKSTVNIRERDKGAVIMIESANGTLVRIEIEDATDQILITCVDKIPLVQPKAANQILIRQE